VFYREIEKSSDDASSDGETQDRIFLARGYWVFGTEQVAGYTPATHIPANPIQRNAAADRYFAATGARVVIGGTQACYRPATDTIHMPDDARFIESDGRTRTQAWYGVLGHETCHFTGAPSRLARDFGKRFGDDAYCLEEACAPSVARHFCAPGLVWPSSLIPIMPVTSITG